MLGILSIFCGNFRIILYIPDTILYYVSVAKNESNLNMSGIEGLTAALCRINEPRKMQELLQEILTPAEYHDLALRWALMERLDDGQTQRQIASDLGISLCKITRGAKILKKQGAVTKQYLKTRRKT